MREYLLELVPMWFRKRWPMKQFYWQPEDLTLAAKIADKLHEYYKENLK